MRELLWTLVIVGLGIIIATEADALWRRTNTLPEVCPACGKDMTWYAGEPWCTRCQPPPWEGK